MNPINSQLLLIKKYCQLLSFKSTLWLTLVFKVESI